MKKLLVVIFTILLVSSVNAESLQDVKERMQYDSITVEEKELTKVMIFIMKIIIKLNLKLKRSPKCVKEYIL